MVEYRFVGDQAPGNPGAWAFRNSGAMLHSPDPRTMPRDQTFPISIEAQFLGGKSDGKPRPTANMCSPGTEVVYQGTIYKDHCLNSSSPTFDGEQWVRAELVVHGSGTITHFANGQKVLEYSMPQYGGGVVDNYDATTKIDGKLIEGGYISLQSESHPIDFRKVELLNLAGCTDKAATNYKSYYVKPVPEDCKFAEGAKPAMRRPGRIPGERGSAAAGRHSEGPPRRSVRIPQQDHRRHGAPLLDLRARAIQPEEAAPNVLVFQDGQRATNPNGPLRLPQVMENLIGKGKMPVTIGIFITPGNLSETYPDRSRMQQSESPQGRVRRAERHLRALPHRGDASGSGQEVQPHRRSGEARHRRHFERRHLRVHRRLAAARHVPPRHQHDRQLHVHRLLSRRRMASP